MANLITSPENFTTGWTVSAGTVSANSVVAADGTTTADTLSPDDANANQSGIALTTATAHNYTAATLSYAAAVFAKANESDWIYLVQTNNTNGDFSAYFNVASGTVGTLGADVDDAYIVNYGGGWYRCVYVFTNNGSVDQFGNSQIRLAEADGDNTVARNGPFSVHFWGASLNTGTEAETYVSQAGITVTADTGALQARRRNIIKRRRANAALARPRKELWAGRPVNNPKYR